MVSETSLTDQNVAGLWWGSSDRSGTSSWSSCPAFWRIWGVPDSCGQSLLL